MDSLSWLTLIRSISRYISPAGVFSMASSFFRNSSMRMNSPLCHILEYPCWISISSCFLSVRSFIIFSGASTANFVPGEYCIAQFTMSSGVCTFTSLPLYGEYVRPMRAKSSRIYSYISVDVPTVLLGFLELTFCSMAMAGGSPLMKSHSGLLILPRYCLAYDERDST